MCKGGGPDVETDLNTIKNFLATGGSGGGGVKNLQDITVANPNCTNSSVANDLITKLDKQKKLFDDELIDDISFAVDTIFKDKGNLNESVPSIVSVITSRLNLTGALNPSDENQNI